MNFARNKADLTMRRFFCMILDMANTFGQLFRITTWGESHGGGVGVVVDGCPPKLKLTEADIQPELNRRRPGQSKITSRRREPDIVQILSGTFEGKTLGTPICLWVKNEDARPEAYSEMKEKFRPSHADFTYFAKYGIRNWEGGGRASARETVGRVAAGAIAKKILREQFGVETLAYVKQVQKIVGDVDPEKVKLADVESNIVRCPDQKAAKEMIQLIDDIRQAGDTVGGIVEGVARGVPAGWGEPVFDKLGADLAKAMLSLPATRAFEIGSGFSSILMTGREHNDAFRARNKKVFTTTNFSGGIQGGISNGQTIFFRVAFKPVATVMHEQDTVDVHFENTKLKARGRHDPCVLPRAVPMIEAMTALVLVDHALRHKAQCG
ncbi:MAG TPA: chorismate synthase [Candidatus Aquilonibacter sp.]|nr:chorismate synthase [Candidatus Aquilonibacter sp.]